jgi:hypothetical protein
VIFPQRLQLAFFLFFCACGGSAVGPTGHEVGAVCSKDSDCAKRCTLLADFGNGMCTRPCASDPDCPKGTRCVAVEGGICALSCRTTSDCSGFGQTFVCESKSQPGGGEVLVCRKP